MAWPIYGCLLFTDRQELQFPLRLYLLYKKTIWPKHVDANLLTFVNRLVGGALAVGQTTEYSDNYHDAFSR